MATPGEPQSTGTYRLIKFEISTCIARITLNNPPYNVLNVPLMKELAEAIESLSLAKRYQMHPA